MIHGIQNFFSNAMHSSSRGTSLTSRSSINERKSYDFKQPNRQFHPSASTELRALLSSRQVKTPPSTASERHRDIHERYGVDRPSNRMTTGSGTMSHANRGSPYTSSIGRNDCEKSSSPSPGNLRSPNRSKTQPSINHLGHSHANKQNQQSHPHPHRSNTPRPSTTTTVLNPTPNCSGSNKPSVSMNRRTPRPTFGGGTRGETRLTEDSRSSDNPHSPSNPSRREHQNQQKNDNSSSKDELCLPSKEKTILRDKTRRLAPLVSGIINPGSSTLSSLGKNYDPVLSPKNSLTGYSSSVCGSNNKSSSLNSNSRNTTTTPANTRNQVDSFVVEEGRMSTDDDEYETEESDMDEPNLSFAKGFINNNSENHSHNDDKENISNDNTSFNKNVENATDTETEAEDDDRKSEACVSKNTYAIDEDSKNESNNRNEVNVANQESQADNNNNNNDNNNTLNHRSAESDLKKCARCKTLAKNHAKQLHKIKGLQIENGNFAMIVRQKRELVEQLQQQVKLIMRENQQLAKICISSEQSLGKSNSSPNLSTDGREITAGLGFPIVGKSQTYPVMAVNHITMEGDSAPAFHAKKSNSSTNPLILNSIHSLNHHRKVAVSPEHLKEAEDRINLLTETCDRLTWDLDRKNKEHERMHKFLSDLLYTLNGRGFESLTDTEGNVIDLNRCRGETYLDLKGRDQRQKVPVRRIGANDYMFKAIIGSQEKMIQNLISQLETMQRDVLVGDKLSSRSRESGSSGIGTPRSAVLESEILQLMNLIEGTCQRYPDVFLALREQSHQDNSERISEKLSSPRPDYQNTGGMVEKILDRCERLILTGTPVVPSYAVGPTTTTNNHRGFQYFPVSDPGSTSKPSSRGKSRGERDRDHIRHNSNRSSDALTRSYSEDLKSSKSENPRTRSRQSRRTRSGGGGREGETSPIRCSSQPIISAEFTQSDDSFNGRSGSGTLDNQNHHCPVSLVSSSSSSKTRPRYSHSKSVSGTGSNPLNNSNSARTESETNQKVANNQSSSSSSRNDNVKFGPPPTPESDFSSSINDYRRAERTCTYCDMIFDHDMTAKEVREHLEMHLFQINNNRAD